ncbi:reverse transcriptase [Tanacetum coccineum]
MHLSGYRTFKEPLILSVEDRVGPNKDDLLGRCMLPLQHVERRLDHKAINTRRFNLEKHVMVVEGEKKKEVKSSKLIMVKKEVSIQMVVASRAFGLTLLEPSIFFTRKVNGVYVVAFLGSDSLIVDFSFRVCYGYSGISLSLSLLLPMLNLLIMFSLNATLLSICGSSFLDGVIFLFFKLLLGILSMIGSSLGMLLGILSMIGSLLRFFGGFGDTEIASRPNQRRDNGGQTGQQGSHNGGGYGRLTKVEFPKFEGEEVVSWIYKVNKFFEMDNIVENKQKMRLVSMHLFGKALNWHRYFMSKFGAVMTWEVYQTHVRKRFESVFEDPVGELKNLRQTTRVQVYQESFEELFNKVDVNDDFAVSLFIGGLREEIAYAVRMFKPTSLSNAFCLAKLQEANNSVNRGRSTTVQTISKNVISAPYNKGESHIGSAWAWGGVGFTVAKNVVTMPAQTQTVVQNRPFRRLTQKEMEDKRATQLCYYYDQKYTLGHKCSGQMYSLEVVGCDEEIVEEECETSE